MPYCRNCNAQLPIFGPQRHYCQNSDRSGSDVDALERSMGQMGFQSHNEDESDDDSSETDQDSEDSDSDDYESEEGTDDKDSEDEDDRGERDFQRGIRLATWRGEEEAVQEATGEDYDGDSDGDDDGYLAL